MPEPTFVGRKEYEGLFNEMVSAAEGEPYILNLRGKGGVGKTKILHRFVGICNKKGIPLTDIVDFQDYELTSPISLIYNISKSLERYRNLPRSFWSLYERYQEQSTPESEDELIRNFGDCLKNWSEDIFTTGKRGILIFDTFEVVRYTILYKYLVDDWLPQIKTAVVILSGRQEKAEIDFPAEIKHLVIDKPVNVFTEEEAVEYLQLRDVWKAIEEDKAEKTLFNLTQFNPLLLALSAEWGLSCCEGGVSFSQLVGDSNIKNYREKLALWFSAHELNREDNFILSYMAHIPRPFDSELMSFLYSSYIPQNELEDILQKLSEFSFVKELKRTDGSLFYRFHDEVKLIFQEYLFKDESWKKRLSDLSKRMIAFYDRRIDKFTGDDEKKNKYIAYKLYHEIYLSPNDGFDKFQRMFEVARETYQYGFASLLIGVIRSLVYYLPEPQQYILQLAEGRWLRDMGDVRHAKERFSNLLKDHGKNPKRAPYIYDALAFTSTRLGQIEEAIEYHNKCINYVKKISSLPLDEQISKDEQSKLNYFQEWNLGNIYRRKGERKKSIEHLRKAKDLALEQKNERRVADILCDIAVVYTFAGDYKAGLEYAKRAVDIFRKLGLPSNEAKVKVRRADIYRLLEQYDDAEREIWEAIENFEEEDSLNLSLAYYYLGFTEWYKGVAEDNWMLIKKSKTSFEECIGLSRKYEIPENLMRALHQVSEVYWNLGYKKKARDSNDEAMVLSEKINHIRYQVNCIVKKAEFDYEDKQYDKIEEHARALKEFEKQGYEYPFFYGRIDRILGEIALEKKEYDKAADYYSKGLYLISQHGGYGRYKIKNELDKLKNNIDSLTKENALIFYRKLKEYWIEKGLDIEKPEMVIWAEKHINDLIFR